MTKAHRTPEQKRLAKARRQQRKRDARREAVRAIWDDREHQARPTRERVSHGVFSLGETEAAGVRYARDHTSTELDWLYHRGTITADQLQGGMDFADLLRRTRLVSQGRSCMNFDPVGHDGDDDTPTSQELRDDQDRRELYLACGTWTWAELRRVCDEERAPTDIDRLRAGLDLCAKFWGKRA